MLPSLFSSDRLYGLICSLSTSPLTQSNGSILSDNDVVQQWLGIMQHNCLSSTSKVDSQDVLVMYDESAISLHVSQPNEPDLNAISMSNTLDCI